MTRVWAMAAGAVMLGLGALMMACSDSTKALPAVGSVTVSPNVVSLQTGETAQLTATVLDEGGQEITRSVTWASSEAAMATVSSSGLVTAVATGAVTITATVENKVGTAAVTVGLPIATVTVTVPTTDLEVGGTVSLAATLKDADGNPLTYDVTWTSSDESIATVDATGKVTGVKTGQVTITATSHGKTGQVTLNVVVPAASVEITGVSNDPLEVGLTRQLGALVRDADGNFLTGRTVTWTSSDPSMATVDATGLVTAVAKGNVTIKASTGSVSATASLKVVGGEVSTELGNNMSYPVVFAEGYGITGLPLTTGAAGDTGIGVRPFSTEGVTVDALPFWYGVAPWTNDTSYYLQQTVNTWQAQWRNGAGSGTVGAEVDWGDNLVGHTWNTTSKVRVEVGLYDYAGPQMLGYNMTVLYGSGTTEMQGTDGSTASLMPLIYTVTPRLLVEKISGDGGSVTATLADIPLTASFGTDASTFKFGAEVNVGGKIVYGYILDVAALASAGGVTPDGWWRVTFQLDNSAVVNGVTVQRNVKLDQLMASTSEEIYPPQLNSGGTATWVDFQIVP